MSASTYRYLPIVVHSHSLTGTSDRSKRTSVRRRFRLLVHTKWTSVPLPSDRFKHTSVRCHFRLLVPTKRMSVLHLLTSSSQCLSIAASSYWYPPSRCLFKPTSVRHHFRLLVPTKPTSVLAFQPIQANICPLSSDRSKPMSVLCLPTGPSQCLSFAFQPVQANVCPLPFDRPKPMSVHYRPLAGTLQPVPYNRYPSTGTSPTSASLTGTLRPVPSKRYHPTGTFRPVHSNWYTFPPFFSVLCKSHPGTLYCWYPSIQSILHLWCKSCQISSCTDHHNPINQKSCPSTKLLPYNQTMVLSKPQRRAAFNHILDVVLGHGDGSPLKTSLINNRFVDMYG